MYISSKRAAKAIKTSYVYYMRTLILDILLLKGTAKRRGNIEAFHTRLMETVVIICAIRVAGAIVKQT